MTKSFRIPLWVACLAVAPAVNAQIQIEQVLGQAAMAYEVLVRPRPGVSLGQLAAAFDSDSVRPFGSSGWVKVRSRSMGASSLVVAANVSSLISAAHPNYVIRALETQPSDPDFGIGAAAPRESIIFPANLTLAVATEATLALQLSSPAPAAGLVLTLKSNNSSVARLNVDTLFIPGGQSSSSRTRVSGLAAGLALITAEADGYASATVAVQVSGSTGTLAFAPATFSFAGPGTQNVTLTLSPPAPATGLTIQLSSSNAAAASAPASVTVSANASSIAIPITAMGPGQSVVGATAANYGPGSLLVTVSTLPAGLTITSTSLATGEEGQPYAQTLAAVGGTKPYTWSVTGTLPAGLTLNSLTGVLIGIPQAASANTALLFRVADSGTPAKSAFVSLSLNITGAGPVGESILMVTNLALAAGTETALIVQISSPAPVGGLDLLLTNDNPAVAGLNVNTLFIPAGQMSTSRTRVSGRSAGLARVTVSAPNSAPRFAPASVAVQVSGLAGTNQ